MRLTHDEDGIVALVQTNEAKRAALFFDEVMILHRHWSQYTEEEAEEARELYRRLKISGISGMWGASETVSQNGGVDSTDFSYGQEGLKAALHSMPYVYQEQGAMPPFVPVYGSEAQFISELENRDRTVWRVLIDNLPVVDNDALSWEHVKAAREDPELVSRFRELRIWMRKLDPKATKQQISDDLEQRIVQYHWAMRKHGIKSITGALSLVANSPKLATVSSVVGGAFYFGGSSAAALSALGILLGEGSLRITEFLVGREDVKATYPEVAFLHDLAEKAKK